MSSLRRAGFTLLEVVLALSLAAVLIVAVGASIHIFTRVTNASRNDVADTQLAHALLQRIAGDLRATVHSEPPDANSLPTIPASVADAASAATDAASKAGVDLQGIGKPSGRSSSGSAPTGSSNPKNPFGPSAPGSGLPNRPGGGTQGTPNGPSATTGPTTPSSPKILGGTSTPGATAPGTTAPGTQPKTGVRGSPGAPGTPAQPGGATTTPTGGSQGSTTPGSTTSTSKPTGGTSSTGSSSKSTGGSGGSSMGSGSTGGQNSSSGSGSSSSSDSSSQNTDSTATTTPPGVYGAQNEIQLDVSCVARPDGRSASAAGSTGTRGGIKTVTYYLQAGSSSDGGAGLYRSEVDRSVAQWTTSQGGSSTISPGQVSTTPGQLLAPEVTDLEFQYFDGTNWQTDWDSSQQSGPPVAVEISLTLAPLPDAHSGTAAEPKTYRMVVRMPAIAPPSTSDGSSSSSDTSDSSNSSSSGSSNSSSSGSNGSSSTQKSN